MSQPRHMPNPQLRTTVHQTLEYYPIPHPAELESFMSKCFYVVTVSQDVGIFATWYADLFFFSIITDC